MSNDLTATNLDGSREGPRLLASTGPLLIAPLGWTLDAIADAGYTGAELLVAHNSETRDPEKVLGFAREAGLDIPVVHGPYMLLLRTVLGSGFRGKTERSLELAAELGARTMVAHAPFRWELGARAWLAEGGAEEHGDEFGVSFAMENLFPVGGRTFSSVVTPEQLAPFRHVVFDTSHFGVAGVDLFDAWDVLGDRCVHLHVSDNFGTGKDSHAPIGAGVLPLGAFLGHIGRSGYSGTITLEVDCRAHVDSRERLVRFLANEREKVQALLAGEPASDLEPLDA